MVVPSCQMTLTLTLSLMIIKVAGSQQEVHLQVPLTVGRRGAVGDIIPDVSQSSSSLSVVQVGILPKLLHQWRRITSNGFWLNMKGSQSSA